MEFEITKEGIKVYNKEDFCPQHILECGQMFCYEKCGQDYFVYPQNKFCKIIDKKDYFFIETKDPQFFVDFFNLNTNYAQIKKQLCRFDELKFAINYGKGIRIVKQDLFETIITFIFSANNNMKRIKASLDKLRQHFGEEIAKIDGKIFYAFPTLEQLKTLDATFFKSIGAGYRAEYLVETINVLGDFLNNFPQSCEKTSNEILENLLKLKGVGRKVADCILLFGYNRNDVFPVDTWIKQVYSELFFNETNAVKISNLLKERYKNLSGYAQQYLFYSKRSLKHV